MKKRSGSKVSIVKRRREAEQLLMNAVKQGKANFLEKDLPTDWRPTPPMPPSMIKMVMASICGYRFPIVLRQYVRCNNNHKRYSGIWIALC